MNNIDIIKNSAIILIKFFDYWIKMLLQCFASTNRGLEDLLLNELRLLGASDLLKTNAGVTFNATFILVMKINLHSRLASRIFIQVAYDYYQSEQDIYNLAYKIKWHEYFDVNNTIKISTGSIGSLVKSLDFVNLRTKDAICDNFANYCDKRPDVKRASPDIHIYNFLTKDTITMYLDTSGECLFKRGYRIHQLDAPIKENLAAGMLQLINWQPTQVLFDPMCGSGTIIIEALMQGLNIASGLIRDFAFIKLLQFDKLAYQQLQLAAYKMINYHNKLQLYANDIDDYAVSVTKENLVNLFTKLQSNKLELLENDENNVSNDIDTLINKYVIFTNQDCLHMVKPQISGIMLSNPPYGVRLQTTQTVTEFCQLLASNLKKNFHNWTCYFISANRDMPQMMRLKTTRKIPLINGDLDCRLFEFKMVDGSNRAIRT